MTDIKRRVHQTEQCWSEALYSPCETYRYGLQRQWGDGKQVLFVMLNPSTATELRNDPTIERCERRARVMGYCGLRIANLFAFRATDPRDLRRARSPIGEATDSVLAQWHAQAAMTVAGWGVHGAWLSRGKQVRDLPPGRMYHLGLTKGGHPRHPLYVAYARQPEIW